MNKSQKSIIKKLKPFMVTLIISIFLLSNVTPVVSYSLDDLKTVKYSFPTPIIESVSIGGTQYDRIILPDCTPAGNPGEPMIPSKGAFILLPPHSKVTNIQILTSKKIELEKGLIIEPMGQPIPLTDDNFISIPTPNKEIYHKNSIYPQNLYTEVGTYGFRGYQILVLQLHPIQYNPVSKELFYYKDMTVRVETENYYKSDNLYRGLEKDRFEVFRKVDNPKMSEIYDKELGCSSSIDEQYDMLIITTDTLKEGFEPLKEAHNETNVETVIKTLTDVGSSNLEDIRNYITDAYANWGIEYVLIGGDDVVIPDPLLWVYGLDENTTPYETQMPSDLYYACLDGPYNYDGDDKWGETTDGEDGGDVDLIAEIYVGRACVDNLNDVDNFVIKTINYINKDPEDEYLTKYLLVGEYMGDYGIASWAGNYMDQLIDGCTDDGYTTVGIPSDQYTIETLYDRDWPGNNWPKSEIMNRINEGVHVINHLGHSSYDYNLKMYYEDVYDFTNTDLCFIYSQGCMAGGFDYNYYDCFAEHSTVKIDKGPFAGIWNARYGWFWSDSTDGDSQRFQRQFWDAVFGENIPVIGKANHDSKEDNLHIISRSCIRWCYYQLNLFGDPSLSFFEVDSNNPPEPPRKPSEKLGEQFTFTTNSTDPDGDLISYRWSWGDGNYSEWMGPFESGETCEASYIWMLPDIYEIRAQATDTYGGTSNWSEPLSVKVDLPIIELGNITGGLFKIKIIIKNSGTAEAIGVNCSIKLNGDLIIMGKDTLRENLNIEVDEQKIIKSKPIFGFGEVMIRVVTDGNEKTAFAYLIGPFIFM